MHGTNMKNACGYFEMCEISQVFANIYKVLGVEVHIFYISHIYLPVY